MTDQDNEDKIERASTAHVDWPKVSTNAVSTLVATMFVGAAAIMWQAAIRQPEAIRTKVNEAKAELQATQQSILTTQDEFSGQIAQVRLQLNSLRNELQRFSKAWSEHVDSSETGSDDDADWNKDFFRAPSEIDTSKMLFEKEQILDHLQQKLETDRTRNQQFNPAQHPVK